MTDQQRWDALGCVNPLVQTPHLDALAQRGVRYDQAVCQNPICVPSRYSLMLGLYSCQSGLRHNQQMCPTDADLPGPVLPQRLADAGYDTAGFGKVHWYTRSGKHPIPTTPSTRGFGSYTFHRDRPRDAAVERLGEQEQRCGPGGQREPGYQGFTSTVPAELHHEAWLTDRAIDWLDQRRADPAANERPFFLYLSFDAPHPGFVVPPGYEDRYDLADIPDRPLAEDLDAVPDHAFMSLEPMKQLKEQWKRKSPEQRRLATLRYYALCSYVDDQFSRLIQKLESLELLDDTLIVFCSDHGEMLGDRHHRFCKMGLYEGSIRVPLILAGRGVPAEWRGRIDRRPAELVDLVPTLMQLAGRPAEPTLPGLDLLGERRRAGAFAEYHGEGYEPLQMGPACMWRTAEWKLILSLQMTAADAPFALDAAVGELYHLAQDPAELRNRYDDPACRDICESMTRDLLMHLMCQLGRYPFRPFEPAAGDAVTSRHDPHTARPLLRLCEDADHDGL